MAEMKIYTASYVDPNGEDTEYVVRSDSEEAAARLYVQAAIDEEISADIDDLRDAGILTVRELYHLSGQEPGIVQWSDIPAFRFKVEDVLSLIEHDGPDPEM